MIWLFPAIVATLAGALCLTGIYYYLYRQERDRALGVWTAAWGAYSIRFIIMLGMLLHGRHVLLELGYQFCVILVAALMWWGTCLWANHKVRPAWLVAFVVCLGWVIVAIPLGVPFLFLNLGPFLFLGVVTIATGVIILRYGDPGTFGPRLTGSALIIWGLHKFDYPFMREVEWFAPWGYLLGSVLALATGIGMLLLYFEKAKRLLAESERDARTFRTVADRAVHGHAIADLEGNLIYVNENFARVHGYSTEELLGANLSIFHNEHQLTRVLELNEQLSELGYYEPTEVWHVHRDGTEFPMLMGGVAVPGSDGKARAIAATAIDITAQKESEEVLRKSERRYRELADLLPEVVYEADANMRLTFANRQAFRVFGYSAEDLAAGINCLDMVVPEDRELAVANALRRVKEEDLGAVEYTGLRKDGSTFPILVHVGPRFDGDTLLGFTGVIIDLTDRKVVEEQLRQAQKMEAVGQLAGGVAHDFNNLLQAILGYGELAQASIPVGSEAREAVDQMMHAGDRAATVVDQLLAFSRKQVLQMRDIDLNVVVHDLTKMLHRLIGSHIDLEVHTAAGQCTIRADEGQIGQVVVNLCVNARDAMAEGGCITIETEQVVLDPDMCKRHEWAAPGNYVRLRVRDTGEGMDEETLSNVFEPFFTTKEPGKGTGLGLSMVYGLVRQHDGLVNISSRPGEGTVVEVYLPAAGESAEERTRGPKETPRGGHETILVAEDDPLVRSLHTRVLEGVGYRVLAAADGEEAIALFLDHAAEIDLALIDVIMPKQNGRAVYDAIKQHAPATPALFVSGYSEASLHADFVLKEGLRLLRKPCKRDDLLHAVRAALDERTKAH